MILSLISNSILWRVIDKGTKGLRDGETVRQFDLFDEGTERRRDEEMERWRDEERVFYLLTERGRDGGFGATVRQFDDSTV